MPRVLYRNSDDYENEINKVYSWKGISDEEIADIYLTKLKAIDAGKRPVKQHSSSSSDLYAGFRSVPNFHSASVKQDNKTKSDNVMRSYELMKKIAGSNINNNNN